MIIFINFQTPLEPYQSETRCTSAFALKKIVGIIHSRLDMLALSDTSACMHCRARGRESSSRDSSQDNNHAEGNDGRSTNSSKATQPFLTPLLCPGPASLSRGVLPLDISSRSWSAQNINLSTLSEQSTAVSHHPCRNTQASSNAIAFRRSE